MITPKYMKNIFKSQILLLLTILGILILSTTRCNTSENKEASPPVIKSSWDDLIEDIDSLDQWEERQIVLKQRYLELIRDQYKPEKPPLDL